MKKYMNIKIISKVINLESTEQNGIVMNSKSKNDVLEIETEVQLFVQDKANSKIEWHQSSGCVSETLLGATGIPFTHFTAIVTW
jgi:hypothetical protein